MTDFCDKSNMIKVLIVDDHTLTRMGVRTFMESIDDIDVIGEAADGRQAIKAVHELKPDVILLDVAMPVMDGIDAAREIKNESLNTKIIMLTSSDSERDVFASLAAGASGYCLKDVEPERLHMAIHCVQAGDLWLDAGVASTILKYYASTSREESEEGEETVEPLVRQTGEGLAERLSSRETEVLSAIVEGKSNREIADRLVISLTTVKAHVKSILNKLAVSDRTQAAVKALRTGIV